MVLHEGMALFSVVVLAARAVGAAGAVVVRAKVARLAAEGAALVDEFLEFLDGHIDWCLVTKG